jgi:hypothetical protein
MKTNHNLYQAYDPGKGYRLLSIGEETIAGVDEVHLIDKKYWSKVNIVGVIKDPNIPYTSFPFGFYRRKIK